MDSSTSSGSGNVSASASERSTDDLLNLRYRTISRALLNDDVRDSFRQVTRRIPLTRLNAFLLELEQSEIVDRDGETQEAAFLALKDSLDNRESILNTENLVFADQAGINGVDAKSWFLSSTATFSPRGERQAAHREAIENSTILDSDPILQAATFQAITKYPAQIKSILDKDNLDLAKQLKGHDAQFAFLTSSAVILQDPVAQAAHREAIKNSTILDRDPELQSTAFQAIRKYPAQIRSILDKETLDFAEDLNGHDATSSFLTSAAVSSHYPAEQAAHREAIMNSTILVRDPVIQAAAFQAVTKHPAQIRSILNEETLDIAEQVKGHDAKTLFFESAAISPLADRHNAPFIEAIKNSTILDQDEPTQAALFKATANFSPGREAILNRDTVAFAARIQGLDAKSSFSRSIAGRWFYRIEEDEFYKEVRGSKILDHDPVTQAVVFNALEHDPGNREFILHEDTLNLVGQIKTPDAKSSFFKSSAKLAYDTYKAAHPDRSKHDTERSARLRYTYRSAHDRSYSLTTLADTSTERFPQEPQAEFREAVHGSMIFACKAVTQTTALNALEASPKHHESILHENSLNFAEQLKSADAQLSFFKSLPAIPQVEQPGFYKQLAELEILGRNRDVQTATFFAIDNPPEQRESILQKENMDVAELLKGSAAMHRFLNIVATLQDNQRPGFRKDVLQSAILGYDDKMQAATFEAMKTSPDQRDSILKIDKKVLDFAKRVKGLSAKSSFFKSVAGLPRNQRADFCNAVGNSTILTHGDERQAQAFEVTAQFPKQYRSLLDSDNVAFGTQLLGGFKDFLKITAGMSQGQQAAFHEVVENSTILNRNPRLQAAAFEVTARYPELHGSILKKENVRIGARLRGGFKPFLESTTAISQDPEEQAALRRELHESDIWDRDAETQTRAFEDMKASPGNRAAILHRVNHPVRIRIGTSRKIFSSLRGTKFRRAFSSPRTSQQSREDGPQEPEQGFSEFVFDRSSGNAVPKAIRVKEQRKHGSDKVANEYTLTDDSDETKSKMKMDIELDYSVGNLAFILERCSKDKNQYWHFSRDSKNNWRAEKADLVRPNIPNRVWEALKGASSKDKGKGKANAREGRG